MDNAQKILGNKIVKAYFEKILHFVINSDSMAHTQKCARSIVITSHCPKRNLQQYEPFHEGYFRFDDLLQHLVKHSQQLIKNVEYDAVSNTCVGFVLPVNGDGLPFFNVNTSEDIESYFQQHTLAKYAYVYMVQSGVPSFCLASFLPLMYYKCGNTSTRNCLSGEYISSALQLMEIQG